MTPAIPIRLNLIARWKGHRYQFWKEVEVTCVPRIGEYWWEDRTGYQVLSVDHNRGQHVTLDLEDADREWTPDNAEFRCDLDVIRYWCGLGWTYHGLAE